MQQGGIDPTDPESIERLAAFLVERGVLDELTLERARRAQRQSGERFDLVLTRLGLIAEADLARLLAEFLDLPLVDPAQLPEVPLLPDRLQLPFLKGNRIIPVADRGDRLLVAIADPFNTEAAAALSYLLGRPVDCGVMAAGDIERALERLYGRGDTVASEAGAEDAGQASEDDVRRLEDMASEAPVIRLVHELITRAVEAQASDIHVEPREDSVRVRYRIDGELSTVETLPLSLRAAVTSRVKIMAHLNIAERRLPQDGRVKSTVRGKPIDLRVSTMPTMLGESVVLRILDRSSVQLDFAPLGFQGAVLDTLKALLAQPNGIILVTGPTGSGKTTTLYTALNLLNKADSKLFTVEDPIEYQLAGINQIQVQPRIGLTFAHALRSILRQDPDIIMVGEIRDLETAQMAIQASLTGHLVLSTLHTNSAAASITRLMDMGVDDYLLASTLTGVLAQRLVRRLCQRCSAPADEVPRLLAGLGERGRDLGGLRKKVGCRACRNTGYLGRTTISELLVMGEGIRRRVLERGSESALEAAAIENGMVTMFDDGLAKALRGETTVEEVLRVTRMG
ncbi:MAG: Flp pilus assembly complex ATPase component TadA [Hyphomicrobiaceae bacterium]|nr:Flp pilus assembly complex ATPase component TadA [Hyphomicrobiaceae bacterium]